MRPISPIDSTGQSPTNQPTMTDPPGFIPPHGNYQELVSYQSRGAGSTGR